jgi:uncharacterized 2Fe-2S/4Fe-4S cluster protein (DUF4445 family)
LTATTSGIAAAKVEFPEQQIRVDMNVGRTLLDAVLAARLEVSNVCAGRGVCGKCRVIVLSGSEFLSPIAGIEGMSLGGKDTQQGFRIACCARIITPGPISIKIPPETLTEAQQLLVAGIQPQVDVGPILVKRFLTLPQASLTDVRPDVERLIEELQTRAKLPRLQLGHAALKEASEAMRKGQWNITVTVTEDGLITWIDAGRTDNRFYGFALDVGTTKLAGYLVDLRSGSVLSKASMANPQFAHGADVISRISYASEGQQRLDELQREVVRASNSLIRECCGQANVSPQDIFHIMIVGNTAMHHIFLGIPPKYVALAPYTAVLGSSFRTNAGELGIIANPGCLLSALPCVAGFVGADAIADILATEMHKSPSLALLVDIGTNTEIILGDHTKLVSCSAPSGPAFEGGQIKHGMRAEVGAIERIWIDPGTLDPGYSTIGGAKPRGLCGSAVIDAIASMRLTGILDLEGRISPDSGSERVRSRNRSTEYVIAWKEETQIGQDIAVTQSDIEEIKLAKAAIYSAIVVLTKHLKVQLEDITRMFVAGGFGTYVDPYSARVIGMYPDLPLGRMLFVGNTAGSGARMALISKGKSLEAQKIANSLEYVELAADPDFQEEFVNSLYIPHKHAAKQMR